jgi:hypothetical protein
MLRFKTDVFAARVPEVSTLSDDDLEERLIAAEREAMTAKSEYELRNKITHNVLVTDPLLKAVHGDGRSELAEKYVVPQPDKCTSLYRLDAYCHSSQKATLLL